MKVQEALLLFCVLVFFNSCDTKKKCTNKGGDTKVKLEIVGAKEGVYFVEKRLISDWEVLDTVEVDEDGFAEFSLNLNHMEIISIKNNVDQGEIVFVANKGDRISVEAKQHELSSSFRLKGTSENEDLDAFIQYERLFQSYADSLNQVYLALKKNNQHYGVDEKINELYKKRAIEHEEFVKSFIDKNPSRFVNLLAVRSLDLKRNPAYYEKVSNALEKKFSNSDHVAYFVNDVKRIIASEVGGKAPEITLPSYSGTVKKISEYKGKYVLLDFWATWCRPCIAEIPNLKKVHEKFAGNEFEIVSVCVDKVDFKANWKKIIEEYQTEWPQLFDATGVAAQDYGIEYFPTIFLLNKEGEIIAKNLRGADIEKKLSEVLGE